MSHPQNIQSVASSDKSKKTSVLNKMADRYSVDPAKLNETLKATAFRQSNGSAPTNEQMMSLVLVAEQYQLNPFTKEIYAFPDKSGGIVPVVGVDGWSRIMNSHSSFDGIEFKYAESESQMNGAKSCPDWIEAVIHRKDRKLPIVIREYLDETFRGTEPWKKSTKRMLRHKALIQGCRIAFSFTGIYDQDEAEVIIESQSSQPQEKAVAGETVYDVSSVDVAAVGEFVEGLFNRAIQDNTWSACEEYINERLSGSDLQYAINMFTDLRDNHEQSSSSDESKLSPGSVIDGDVQSSFFNNQ